MKPLRVAFLTTEFISEKPNAGGLGNYLNRITQSLKELGHEPEIFVVSNIAGPSVIDFNGIRVERVSSTSDKLIIKLSIGLLRLIQKILLPSPWGGPVSYLLSAFVLNRAFNRRYREKPFDFVQSTNCSIAGFFIGRKKNCPHLIRLSSKRDLWFDIDGCLHQRGARVLVWLEKMAVRKADIAYAPSALVANFCKYSWRSDVKVLRPPVFVETQADDIIPNWLPEQYLIHFGQISSRKGSEFVAQALCQVWQHEPDFKMIWAGKVISSGSFERCHQLWGEQAANVIWLGPIRKERLYAFLQKATAAVLPSLVDNLPNTVIESLMLGTPVIGTKGSSIDELVEHGINGELVEIGDVEALSDAMLRAWRQEPAWIKPLLKPAVFDELCPQEAARGLIKLAGYEMSA